MPVEMKIKAGKRKICFSFLTWYMSCFFPWQDHLFNVPSYHIYLSLQVAGGLASETPHMISAAVKGLARLAYEFTDLVSSAYNVLPSTLLLLQRKNREIIKVCVVDHMYSSQSEYKLLLPIASKFSNFLQANLGLLKVLVAKSQAEGLQAHLRSVVEGLLNWQDNTKNHFKAKVSISVYLHESSLLGLTLMERFMVYCDFSVCIFIYRIK